MKSSWVEVFHVFNSRLLKHFTIIFLLQARLVQSWGRKRLWAPLLGSTRNSPMGTVPEHHSNTPLRCENGTTWHPNQAIKSTPKTPQTHVHITLRDPSSVSLAWCHLVAPNVQLPFPSVCVALQQHGAHAEHLLHHRVLPQVVLTLFTKRTLMLLCPR